jgi:FAD/FMN-containing dehydrogenase
MRGIEVDPERRVARVEAGVIARDLSTATSAYGLSALPGTSADVGVTGYTLGGGLGWLARRHGLACNKVRSIELVTADAEQRRVDGESEPDLFWALRGGGGGFAVVSALELVELPDVYAGRHLSGRPALRRHPAAPSRLGRRRPRRGQKEQS